MSESVSIIILTKNATRKFENTMKAIYSQKFKGDIEVIIIDSGSVDETLDIAKKYGARIFKIRPEDFHHSRTRNLGAEMSKGDFLVYLTQDAIPVNNYWLSSMLAWFKYKDIAAVYSRQIAYPDSKPMDKFFYFYFYPDQRRVLTKEDIKNPKKFFIENVFISNVSSAVRRNIWEKIRFRDEISMAEDKDFALRVLKMGYRIIYEPKSVVYHSHDYTLLSLFKRRLKDGIAYSTIASIGDEQFIAKGLEYFLSELKFLIENESFKWLPYTFVYELCAFSAFQIGKIIGYQRLRKTSL